MLAVDTSVAVPLVVARHAAHDAVTRWWQGRELALSGHAALETYAVLTRLPGDLRLSPADAVTLLNARFSPPLVLPDRAFRNLASRLATAGVAGGATYDGIIGLAALEHDLPLATRDARARATYEALGVQVVLAVV